MKYYKLIDIGKKKHYIFLPILNSKCDTIINKINNKIQLSKDEKKIIIDTYSNSIENIEKYTIIKTAIYDDDTIEIIKKKIMIYLNYDLNKILLFCKTSEPNWKLSNSIKNRILADKNKPSNIKFSSKNLNDINRLFININSVDLILGHEHINKNGLRTFNCDIYNNKATIPLSYDDTINFTEDMLLEEYNNIKNNTLYCIYYDDLDKNETIEQLFYPKLNYQIISDNYKDLLLDYDAKLLNIKDPSIKNNYKLTDFKIENLVIYSNENNNDEINLNELFNKISLNTELVFIKYKTPQKKNLYKVNYSSVSMTYNGKSIKKNISNLKDYVIPYIFNYYKPDVNHIMLEDWKNNKLTLNERIETKNENRLNIKMKLFNVNKSSITLKIKYSIFDNFITVIIHNNGKIDIKLLNNGLFNVNEIDTIIKKVNLYLVKNNLTKIYKKNYNIVNFDGYSTFLIDRKEVFNLKLLEKEINKVYPFAYITYDETNNLIIKYKRVSKFNSFDNYKNYFFKLRKQLKSKSVKDFKKTWIENTKNIFNLSESESLQKYEEISEKIELEDLKRESPESEITIIISLFETTENHDAYNVEIKTCTDLKMLNRIKNFIETLITKTLEKKTKAEEPNTIQQVKIKEVSKVGLVNEDDFDFDDEFEEESDDEEEPDEPVLEQQDDTPLEVKLDPIKLQDVTIRKYMGDMRKRYDNSMYNYKTSTLYEQYSRNCGSADMRQPIIINEKEWNNALKLDNESMSEISYLKWGSSQDRLNYYICPRIWCLRDKVAISDRKFLENNERCPHCGGEVIDLKTKKIGGNNTIIIRKGGSNNYWENLKTSDKFKQSALWKKSILSGTEKNSYPGLLDPKLHPRELCMPCCNTISDTGGKTYKNFDKCLNIVVRATNFIPLIIDNKHRKTTDIDTIQTLLKAEAYEPPYDYVLKEGIVIDKIKLMVGDKVLLVDQLDGKNVLFYGIFEITLNGYRKIESFTHLNLELQEGLTISVLDGVKNSNKIFIVKKNNKNEFIVDNFRDEKSAKFKSYEKQFNKNIINKEKIPIDTQNKYGFLEPVLDKLLGNNLKQSLKPKSNKERNIESKLINRLGNDKSLYLRKGLDHNKKFSFISAIASYKNLPVIDFINLIVENLDPETFCSLNGGDLLKMFSDDPQKLIRNGHHSTFLKWCIKYENFIEKMKLPDIVSFNKNIIPIKTQIKNINMQIKYKKLSTTDKETHKKKWIEDAYHIFKLNKTNAIEKFNEFNNKKLDLNALTNTLKQLNNKLIEQTDKFKTKLEELINTNKDVYKVVMIFYGFEYFKKYCGDMNVYKDYRLFWGLFSMPLNWLFEEGLNILVLTVKDNKVHLDCPVLEDTSILYNNNSKNILLIRQDVDELNMYNEYLFEPVVKVSENFENDNNFKNDKYIEDIFIDNLFVKKLVYGLKNYCGSSKIEQFGYTQLFKYNTIYNLQKIDKNYAIKYQILDEFMKSIGVMTNNGFIIYTRPFGINPNLPVINLSKSQKYTLKEIELHFGFINKNVQNSKLQIDKYLVNNNTVHGIITNYGNIYNINNEMLPSNIKDENIIYTKSKYGAILANYLEDDRITLLKEMNNDMYLGNHLRNELSAFFKSSNKNRMIIKNKILNILENPIDITKHKRDNIKTILSKIFENITRIVQDKNINLNTTKPCSTISYTKCNNNSKCGLYDQVQPKKKKTYGNIKNIIISENETILECDTIENLVVGDVIRLIDKNGNYFKNGLKIKITKINETFLTINNNNLGNNIFSKWESIKVEDNYYSRCKMKVNSQKNLNKHIALIIEEFLNSYVKREAIINGEYIDIESIIENSINNNVIFMDDETYDNKILEIANNNRNIYINQLFTKHNKIIDYNNRINKIILNKHVPISKLTKKIVRTIKRISKPKILATSINSKGIDKSSDKVKAGICKFPYRTKRLIKKKDGTKKASYLTKNECINREGELMCPVELHTSGSNIGQGKVWGYCPNNTAKKSSPQPASAKKSSPQPAPAKKLSPQPAKKSPSQPAPAKKSPPQPAPAKKSPPQPAPAKKSPLQPAKKLSPQPAKKSPKPSNIRKKSSKCKPINEDNLTKLIESNNTGSKKGEWVGPLKDTYIPEALFSKSYSNKEEDAKRLCLNESNCIGITKKKKWSLRKGLELCRSKDESSYIKRDKYKLVRSTPKTIKKKLVINKN